MEHTTDPDFASCVPTSPTLLAERAQRPLTLLATVCRWSEKRFYRILVDYLARTGRPETARTLAQAACIEVGPVRLRLRSLSYCRH